MSRTRRDHREEIERLWLRKDKDIGRDRKPISKSPGWFKRMRSRRRRAKQKQALRDGKEQPIEKKDNDWNWT